MLQLKSTGRLFRSKVSKDEEEGEYGILPVILSVMDRVKASEDLEGLKAVGEGSSGIVSDKAVRLCGKITGKEYHVARTALETEAVRLCIRSRISVLFILILI